MAAPIATMPPRTLSLVLSVARGTSARRVRHFGGVRTQRASPRNCRVDNPWHATRHASARPREPHAAHASVSWFTPSYEPRPSPSGHRNGKWVAYGRRVGGASVASRTFATTTAASDRHDEDSMDAAPLSSTAAYSHFDGVYMKRVWLPADQPVRVSARLPVMCAICAGSYARPACDTRARASLALLARYAFPVPCPYRVAGRPCPCARA